MITGCVTHIGLLVLFKTGIKDFWLHLQSDRDWLNVIHFDCQLYLRVWQVVDKVRFIRQGLSALLHDLCSRCLFHHI